jgi:hypothetical protein
MFVPTYLTKIKDHFKAQTKTWEFFATQKTKEEEWEEFKNSLLKNAYRMSPETEADIYARLETVKQKLNITIPVTMYQLQNNPELNASISFQEKEAHLVFSGPIIKLLEGEELTALIAHELSHLQLYTIEDGDYQVTNRIITAIANDARSENVFLETARYFRLYTEIFCDRGALLVTGDEALVQTSLIKIHTNLEKVSAANYLDQAKEILLTNKEVKSENDTHPENFIRVLAVHLFSTAPDTSEIEIAKLIEHRYDMDRLDIFRQANLAKYTRHLIDAYTSVKWIQTDAVNAISGQYFKDKSNAAQELEWQSELFNQNVREYFGYVLLDLAMADPELENLPLGRALHLSEQFGFKKEFNDILKKEYKLSDKRLNEWQSKALDAVLNVAN